MFKYTDGGRVEAGITDKNDCAVRAYSIFKQIPYSEAHAIFAEQGRKVGKGTSNNTISHILQKDGFVARTNRMTLSQLRQVYRHYRVYALKRGHAFAMIGGVVYDTWNVGSKSRVFKYWVAPMSAEELSRVPLITQIETPQPPAPTSTNSLTPAEKKERAYAIYKWLSYGGMTKYGIAKQIASELNITIANANYYVTRVFNKC